MLENLYCIEKIIGNRQNEILLNAKHAWKYKKPVRPQKSIFAEVLGIFNPKKKNCRTECCC